ncbi:MAG: DUF4292 domain-containing protein [Paramuribaculum sp.]|nr:DUF4292 domain-containing protein [Paramuribaculum sp.]
MNFIKSRHIIIPQVVSVIIVLAVLALSGCKSQKDFATAIGYNTMSMPVNKSERYSGVVGRYRQWERLRLPVNVRINAPTQMSASGTVTMDYGKSILVSMRVLGMEVAVIYVDNDSILIADKFHKRYFSDKVSDLLAGFDVSVSNLQNLLLGRIFELGKTEVPASPKSFSIDDIGGDSWIMLSESQRFSYGFNFNPWNVLFGAVFSVPGHEPVKIEYGKDIETSNGVFATSVDFSTIIKNKAMSATIGWNFDKVKWNDDVELRVPRIGENYRRITAAEVSKMF